LLPADCGEGGGAVEGYAWGHGGEVGELCDGKKPVFCAFIEVSFSFRFLIWFGGCDGGGGCDGTG
jgi:hypothetical protein